MIHVSYTTEHVKTPTHTQAHTRAYPKKAVERSIKKTRRCVLTDEMHGENESKESRAKQTYAHMST